MDITNKQVMAIFAAGVAVLFIAFWAGLSISRRTTASEPVPVPAISAQPQTPSQPDQVKHMVVVGTFGTEEKASEIARELRRTYLSAHAQKPNTAAGERLFRVLIGPYDKRESAEQVQNELLGEGRKGVTVQTAQD